MSVLYPDSGASKKEQSNGKRRRRKREPLRGSSSGRRSPPVASRCVSPGPGEPEWQHPHPATVW